MSSSWTSWLEAVASLPAESAARWGSGDLRVDARRIRPGDVFVALPGRRSHGDAYLRQAADHGAIGALSDRAAVSAPIPVAVVPSLPIRLDEIAERRYPVEFSRLRVAAVTGTNGKTSVTHMLEAIADAAGMPAAVVGTVHYRGPGLEEPARETTPHRLELQRMFTRWAPAEGAWLAAIEASSHALDQGRLGRLPVAVAAVTNLSRDHLDYHGDEHAYRVAKARLFEQPSSGAGVAVVPVKDARFAAAAEAAGRRVVRFGREAGDVRAEILASTPTGLHLRLELAEGVFETTLSAAGDFQVENAACAAAVAAALGIPGPTIAAGLEGWHAAPGRMERVRERPLAFVDYAHTPAALTRCLETARRFVGVGGRLIVVFGAGGNRDAGKRPAMGAAAAAAADLVILTSDNPRDEEPSAILAELRRGVPAGTDVREEIDRRRAIHLALSLAGESDVVVVAGKGHESTQEIRGARVPFDDREEIRAWRCR